MYCIVLYCTVAGEKWATVEDLEIDILDDNSKFDLMMVTVLRKLTSQFILENRQMKLANNGSTSLEEVILDAYTDYE